MDWSGYFGRLSSCSRSQRGPVVAASGSSRSRRPRSAVTTVTSGRSACPTSSAVTRTIVSSPDPGASTTRTSPVSGASSPATARQAAPSSTTTKSVSTNRSCNAASRTSNRRAAPTRSRHHPSGRDPTTLAASTTTTCLRPPSIAPVSSQPAHPTRHHTTCNGTPAPYAAIRTALPADSLGLGTAGLGWVSRGASRFVRLLGWRRSGCGLRFCLLRTRGVFGLRARRPGVCGP